MESNPTFGHGGCCLGISYPQIYDMQVCATFEAACQVGKASIDIKASKDMTRLVGKVNKVGMLRKNAIAMIPLVGKVDELKILNNNAIPVVDAGMQKGQCMMPWMVGTMIEVPRAAILANQVTTQAEIFFFRTNDLTQMGSGSSSDDAGKLVTTPEGFREKMSSLRFFQRRCFGFAAMNMETRVGHPSLD